MFQVLRFPRLRSRLVWLTAKRPASLGVLRALGGKRFLIFLDSSGQRGQRSGRDQVQSGPVPSRRSAGEVPGSWFLVTAEKPRLGRGKGLTMSEMDREVNDGLQEVDLGFSSPADKLIAGDVVREVVQSMVERGHKGQGEQEHEHEQENTVAGPPAGAGACATQATANTLTTGAEGEFEGEGDAAALDTNEAAGPPGPQRKLTAKELLARKQNARRAGVKTAEGKAISRLNARKHGVFAYGAHPARPGSCAPSTRTSRIRRARRGAGGGAGGEDGPLLAAHPALRPRRGRAAPGRLAADRPGAVDQQEGRVDEYRRRSGATASSSPRSSRGWSASCTDTIRA